METCDIIITAKFILTQNSKKEILYNSGLAIKGTQIACISSIENLEQKYTPNIRKDLGNALVMPGLINAHTHIPMVLLRGIADDLPLMEWLTKHIFPHEAKFTSHMIEVGAMLACAEMVRTGTTACMDMYMQERSIMRSIDAIGMKAVVGEGVFDVPSLDHAKSTRSFALIKEHIEELRGHPRIRYAIMPHAVYTTHRVLLEECADLADTYSLPLHMHLAETEEETRQCLHLHGCRPLELCAQAGMLTSMSSFAHCVDVTSKELALLAEKKTQIVHCPRSNMKLASGIAPVPMALEKGVSVSLGTDGASSNNTLNMFSEMSMAALLHKVATRDATTLPDSQVLDMATINGAKALCWPELGCLTVGGSADLIALDLTEANMAPVTDVVSHLVYATSGHEVFFTMVDGTIVYEKGNFMTIDYPAVLTEAQDIRNWLTQKK